MFSFVSFIDDDDLLWLSNKKKRYEEWFLEACPCFVHKARIGYFFLYSTGKRVQITLHVCSGKKIGVRLGQLAFVVQW